MYSIGWVIFLRSETPMTNINPQPLTWIGLSHAAFSFKDL